MYFLNCIVKSMILASKLVSQVFYLYEKREPLFVHWASEIKMTLLVFLNLFVKYMNIMAKIDGYHTLPSILVECRYSMVEN